MINKMAVANIIHLVPPFKSPSPKVQLVIEIEERTHHQIIAMSSVFGMVRKLGHCEYPHASTKHEMDGHLKYLIHTFKNNNVVKMLNESSFVFTKPKPTKVQLQIEVEKEMYYSLIEVAQSGNVEFGMKFDSDYVIAVQQVVGLMLDALWAEHTDN